MPLDDQPAFPRDHASDGHNGMSLRDYFAACALPALLTEVYSWGEQIEGGVANVAAPIAYAVADAMLKARQS